MRIILALSIAVFCLTGSNCNKTATPSPLQPGQPIQPGQPVTPPAQQTITITTAPTAPTSVKPGDAIPLTVVATGNNLTYAWKQLSGQPDFAIPATATTNSITLTVPPLQKCWERFDPTFEVKISAPGATSVTSTVATKVIQPWCLITHENSNLIPNNTINKIAVAKNGIWVGVAGTGAGQQQLVNLFGTQAPMMSGVKVLGAAPNGDVWVALAGVNGIQRYLADNSAVQIKAELLGQTITTVTFSKTETATGSGIYAGFLGTSNGVYALSVDGNYNLPTGATPALSGIPIQSSLVFLNAPVQQWYGTEPSFFRFNFINALRCVYRTEDGILALLNGSTTPTAYNGSQWLGTHCPANPGSLTNAFVDNNDVRTMVREDGSGNIWIGLQVRSTSNPATSPSADAHGGVIRYIANPSTPGLSQWTRFAALDGTYFGINRGLNNVQGIAIDNKQRIWVATSAELDYFTPSATPDAAEGTWNCFSSSALTVTIANQYTSGTPNIGPNFALPACDVLTGVLQAPGINDIAFDATQNMLWMATNYGIVRYYTGD